MNIRKRKFLTRSAIRPSQQLKRRWGLRMVQIQNSLFLPKSLYSRSRKADQPLPPIHHMAGSRANPLLPPFSALRGRCHPRKVFVLMGRLLQRGTLNHTLRARHRLRWTLRYPLLPHCRKTRHLPRLQRLLGPPLLFRARKLASHPSHKLEQQFHKKKAFTDHPLPAKHRLKSRLLSHRQ